MPLFLFYAGILSGFIFQSYHNCPELMCITALLCAENYCSHLPPLAFTNFPPPLLRWPLSFERMGCFTSLSSFITKTIFFPYESLAEKQVDQTWPPTDYWESPDREPEKKPSFLSGRFLIGRALPSPAGIAPGL